MKKYLLASLLLMLIALVLYYACDVKNKSKKVAHKEQIKLSDIITDEFMNDTNGTNDNDVVIQSMLTDMAVPLMTQMGASLANQQIGAQAQELAATLMQQSQTIQANIKSFQTQAQSSQQKDLQAKIAEFIKQGDDVQTETKAAIATSNQELDYLYQNISLNQPQQNYLSSQIVFDQIFSQGTMLTPNGYQWKNPFSVGDWEYEKEDNSFYQYQKSPIYIKSSSGALSSTRAENNSIFTEYSTTAASYTIAGTITFYQVDFPFFAGIIFNKARWISGNSESLRKSRMVGIYAKSNTELGVYYSEQHTMTDEQLKASGDTNPIQSPLQRILTDAVDKKLPIPLDTFKNIKIEPVSFNFEIISSQKTVSFAFWNENNIKRPVTVDNLDPQMFTYHGIGFICPGAIAQFKLTEPKSLVFSDKAILSYKD